MVNAAIWLTVKRDDEESTDERPPTITVDRARLEQAFAACRLLEKLDWTITIDPGGYVSEGYVEFVAFKHFHDMHFARAEVDAIPGFVLRDSVTDPDAWPTWFGLLKDDDGAANEEWTIRFDSDLKREALDPPEEG